jgi:hypothetical protein
LNAVTGDLTTASTELLHDQRPFLNPSLAQLGPAGLEIAPDAPRRSKFCASCHWLYRIDGDTLDICWWPDDPPVRPKEFEAGPGSKNAIYTLKKMKAKK